MRWNLLRKFDAIYILDLHGNSNRKEKCPDGSKDENVFDIQQGVSINFFVKSKRQNNMIADVYHADLWGLRDFKYNYLLSHDIYNIEFQKVQIDGPEYNFKPTDVSLKKEYAKGFGIDELFDVYSVGIVTAKDKVLINSDAETLLHNASEYYQIEADPQKVYPIYYRPLDKQYVYYDPKLIERSRENVMKMFYQDNLGLITARSNKGDDCSQFLVTDMMSEAKCGERTTQSALFPLYTYSEACGTLLRQPNLNKEILTEIETSVGMKMTTKRTRDDTQFTPEELLSYIYAVMYTESYRKKYKEFINAAFPRVPYPQDKAMFKRLIAYGEKLMKLHLMHDLPEDKHSDNDLLGKKLEKVTYKNNSVFINKTDCFIEVEERVWKYVMCGYQPLQKWLKDRKGITFTKSDITHFRQMQYCIEKTINIVNEIK